MVGDGASSSSPTAPDPAVEFAELLPSAIGVVDVQGIIVWANDACRQLFDWDVAARSRVHISELIDTNSHGLANEMQHRMVSGDTTPLKVATRMLRLDGTPFSVHVHAKPIHYGPQRTTALLSVITPVDDNFDDNSFRRAMDMQRELVCEWALDGRILFGNRSYHDVLHGGRSAVGHNLDDYVKWTEGNSREALVQRLITGEPTFTNTSVYAGGRAVEWSNTLVRSADGTPVSVLAVGRDVTERLRVEAALRRNEERFRTMVTYIWDSILLMDRTGSLIDSTSAYRTDLGYAAEFWDSVNLFSVLHPDDQEAALATLADLMARGNRAETWMEVRARRADGTYSWLEVNGANLLHDPAVNAIILTVRNIDRRKEIENELASRHADAQAALRQRVGFVAQVSHELRNPLHGMLGLSEMLTKADLAPALADAAWAIYRQSTTMRRIVDDLLDVAQLEVGTLRVNREHVDLQYVFNDAAAVAREILATDVDLVVIAPPTTLRYVEADHDRIRQALANLLSNACKHTHHGEIRVAATEGEHPGTVRVSVFDSGSGIDADDVERLFQPYERGQATGTPGVGLGLAIVKGTIEAMGGTVGARPLPEGGSCFWFELNATEAPTASDRDTSPATDDSHFVMRVLVVDDDPVNLLVARMQLNGMGADVTTATSGDEAWGLLREYRFDVAFIDVQMPGMDGLELVRLTRALPQPRPLTAVMTASATAADQQAALEAGADAFVPKPATSVDFREVLQLRADRTGGIPRPQH